MVTHEDVMKIAALAKLSVAPEELDALTKDMNEIIGFADTVSTIGVEASDFDNINRLSNVFRDDTVRPSFDREEILKNAENREDGYFLVKRRA